MSVRRCQCSLVVVLIQTVAVYSLVHLLIDFHSVEVTLAALVVKLLISLMMMMMMASEILPSTQTTVMSKFTVLLISATLLYRTVGGKIAALVSVEEEALLLGEGEEGSTQLGST